jgi:hypothetical protein
MQFLTIFLATISLFYTPHNYGFIPHHTTVCPSIKYYTTLEEILNQKPEPVIKKRKEKKTRISKIKKRMLAEKNKEKEYIKSLIYNSETNDYETFANQMIDFYNAKLKASYKDYMMSKKIDTNEFEKYVMNLKDILDNPEMLYIKNKRYNFITHNILNIIDGFELLVQYTNTCSYDYLTNTMMSNLHDIVYFSKK